MKPGEDTNVDRRTWLASCARSALLGSVTVAAGVLVCRGQVGACSRPLLACDACQGFACCELPRAADVRARLARKEDD